MTQSTIKCPYCTTTWDVQSVVAGITRDSLVNMAPAAAAHMRDVHGDEASALRFERWAVTPPPYRRVNSSE